MYCQICSNEYLNKILSLGYMPPVNQMVPVGSPERPTPWFPTTLYHCAKCELVQLGIAVDQTITFPPEYPYTSGMTKVLRDNFADLHKEATELLNLKPETDSIIDIGSNDGTLLKYFEEAGHHVLGIEPTDVAKTASVPTLQRYFDKELVPELREHCHGPVEIITAANCFAHIDGVHEVLEGILELLDPKGVFISESHYLMKLLETVQYDTIYHEHLRYYSVTSLKNLFEMHNMEIFHVKRIPTHGGSIRVYAARKDAHYPVNPSVAKVLATEGTGQKLQEDLEQFSRNVLLSKLQLNAELYYIKLNGHRVAGIGAPSRASTLINYTGLDASIIDYVCELEGSLKIGKYMPGTLIPVVEESRLFEMQPEYAIIFSWHIAEELMPKLRAKGYRGTFIVPLPTAYTVP